MSSNGNTHVDVIVRADMETGRVNLTGPDDPVVLLQILMSAQGVVLQKIAAAREASKPKTGVQIAPASALPRINRG